MEAKTEWKMGGGGGGGGHTLQLHSLGTGDKCPPHPQSQISKFGLGLGGDTKGLFPPRPDYRRFNSHHLQARATLTAMSVPPQPPFLSTER